MFRVPAPHEHGTVLHAPRGTAVVLDGYAVHEDPGTLIHVAETFGLASVEPVTDEPAAPAPAPVTEPDHALSTWLDDGGATHEEVG